MTIKKKDMFEQVVFTNLTFNNQTLDKNDPNFWVRLKNQAKLVQEELDELHKAIEEKNFKELRDAVADINVTNFGVAHIAGIDCKKDMNEVFLSNISKVSKTLKDAEITQEYYLKEKGVETYLENCPTMPGYIVKVKETVIGKDNKEYVKGKFLKCRVSFVEPNLNNENVKKPRKKD